MQSEMTRSVARRRAAQLRIELAAVERLVEILQADVSSARAAVRRERGSLARTADPFERWWWQYMNNQSRLTWKEPVPDATQIDRGYVELAEAQTSASIATELASIAHTRAMKLRGQVAKAEARADGNPHAALTNDAVIAEVWRRNTLGLVHELRRAIDAADIAASHAVRDAIIAALRGGNAAIEAKRGSFVHAMRDLARARVQLELVVASLVPLRGARDPIVCKLAAIARDLRNFADAPDETWRRQVAAIRARITAALGELEAQVL